jgi:hypothetical protein
MVILPANRDFHKLSNGLDRLLSITGVIEFREDLVKARLGFAMEVAVVIERRCNCCGLCYFRCGQITIHSPSVANALFTAFSSGYLLFSSHAG